MALVRKYQNFFFCFAIFLCGHNCIWPGSDIDSYFSVSSYAGCFFYLLFFLVSILSWGRLAQNHLLGGVSRLGLDIAFGSAIVSFLFAVQVHLGLLGSWAQASYLCVLLFGPILADLKKIRLLSISNLPREGRWAFSFLALIAIFRLLQAIQPWGSTDPLFYHLLSARVWFEQGKVQYISNLNLLFQSRNWEYLYLGVMELTSGGVGRGLIEVQIISQCLHCILGYFGSGLLVYDILRAIFHKSRPSYLFLACAMAMMTLDMAWMAPTAKNDWGVCLWCLAAAYLLPIFHEEKLINRALCCGFFFGLAFSAKFVVAPTILGFFLASLAYGIWNRRGDFYFHLLIPIAAIFAASPILFRNWYFTKNPFFPELGSYFGFAQMSETMIQQENKIRSLAKTPT